MDGLFIYWPTGSSWWLSDVFKGTSVGDSPEQRNQQNWCKKRQKETANLQEMINVGSAEDELLQILSQRFRFVQEENKKGLNRETILDLCCFFPHGLNHNVKV